MQVILIKHLRKCGRIGDLVDVKPGYARNYLLPQNFAIRATQENKLLMEKQKRVLEDKNALAKIEADNLAQNIVGKEVIFIKQASEDGRLFGSVGNKDIARVLSELLSHKVSHTSIILSNAIKSIGVFTVEIELHAEVITSIVVVVARSETEASDAIRNRKDIQTTSEA